MPVREEGVAERSETSCCNWGFVYMGMLVLFSRVWVKESVVGMNSIEHAKGGVAFYVRRISFQP